MGVDFKDRVRSNPFRSISKAATKGSYRYGTRRLDRGEISVMNVGYEEDPPMALPLEASDEPNRYPIQLYHRTATQADLSGKRVLEVGCGLGGGASYLMRTLQPASYTGLDLNATGIEFCRRRHNVAGLDFVEGDAENLPFPDDSFDALINIESSVHYPRFPRFLSEVSRVLRPGGHFLYTDFRVKGIDAWKEALDRAPMRMVASTSIHTEVARAMDKNTEQRYDMIDRTTPAFLRRVVRVLDSRGVNRIRSGRIPYEMYCFVNE
ncbi:SAM-dependent methyltransferase [Mycolicibacterium sp. GF69]|uniref:phthiotriol/phenolphthiotriol dimycocerosates methyltransferase n=1 Tax=Mycolicibacterium sp. GF69 TaxID=2267251 RepID=UPI000DCC1B23|nr:class I SAM-dependent methyltransferase [Mycolicibacterium sp. GF69]RAV13510.1 SAM-dependent methyltransferase [Mycolicibacterium sp. GF69]